jgi:hypothetical protein
MLVHAQPILLQRPQAAAQELGDVWRLHRILAIAIDAAEFAAASFDKHELHRLVAPGTGRRQDVSA